MKMSPQKFFTFGLFLTLVVAAPLTLLALTSPGTVSSFQKISDTAGGFTATIDDSDQLGSGIDDLGDINDDGVDDLIIGAWKDDDAGTDFGAAYILLMNTDGTVSSYQKITNNVGGFSDGLIDGADDFGYGVWGIGDLDGDGVPDAAISERAGDDGGTSRGAFYVVFLNANGTVKGQQEVSDLAGGFTGVLDGADVFGECVINVGDVNDDDVSDLAVCAKEDDDGGTNRGALWVLYMNTDGTVAGSHKISNNTGGFGALDDNDKFGVSMTTISDLNGDGINEWVVGSTLDDDGAVDAGAVYILFMNADGTVDSQAKVSSTTTNFTGQLETLDRFGASVADAGDLDGDGFSEIVVGSWGDDDGGADAGAAYIIYLDSAAGVKKFQKISALTGYRNGALDIAAGDNFGLLLSTFDDMNGDGLNELAVGAIGDDDGGTNRGAAWQLYLYAVASGDTVSTSTYPTNLSLTINDGAVCTPDPEVSLKLAGSDVQDVVIGNDEFFIGSNWEAFIQPSPMTKSWTLPATDGQHTVYVSFRSSDMNQSTVISKTITLDQAGNCGVLGEDDEEPEPDDEEPVDEGTQYGPSPVTGQLEAIDAVEAGDYIRSSGLSTIYYVDQDLKRHPFYNESTYCTWNDSFDDVKTVSDATLPTLTLGSAMLSKPGVVMIKLESDPKVYVVESSSDSMFTATLRHLESETVARELFGSDWADYIIDMPVTLFKYFSYGNVINSADDYQVDQSLLQEREALCK